MPRPDQLDTSPENALHTKLIERIAGLFIRDREQANDQISQRFKNGITPTTRLNGTPFLNKESGVLYDISLDINEKSKLTQDHMKSYFEKHGISIIEQLLDVLGEAESKYREVLRLIPDTPEDTRKKIYKLRITSGQNMSTPFGGGAVLDIGDQEILSLLAAVESGDEDRYADVRAGIASQFFHEQLHYISSEILETETVEELTMIGELLYDPANNATRNDIVFGAYGNRSFYEERLRTSSDKNTWNVYDQGWKGVGIPILIHELVSIGKINHDDIQNNFREIAESLPNYFADVPENQRMAIVAKYATVTRGELYNLGKDFTVKYQLNFKP